MMSVLRDTLDNPDPAAARLGKVWIYGHARPGLLQRIEALSPLLFKSRSRQSGDGTPAPVLDLSTPLHQTWRRVAGMVTQVEVLDPRGALIRAPTRSYRGSASTYTGMKTTEALAALQQAGVAGGPMPDAAAGAMPEDEWLEFQARLALSARLLGGVIRDARLPEAWTAMAAQLELHREHNWDLLRQRAEQEGLYFEALDSRGPAPSQAVLWVSQQDLAASSPNRPFNPSFLRIGNPWRDNRLKEWKGYHETWYWNAAGEREAEGSQAARAETMIPLAIYSLDYDRVPLLLVDFRDGSRISRREAAGRISEYVATGVFGLTGMTNWPYLAGHATLQWYRARHGAATDEAQRLNAYAGLRLELLAGSGFSEEFRQAAIARMDQMSLNPFEMPLSSEAAFARAEYARFLRYAQRPDGLAADLQRERGREMVALLHGRRARSFFTAGSILTASLWHHREPVNDVTLSELVLDRRMQATLDELRHMVNSSPTIDVAYDPSRVRDRLAALTEMVGRSSRYDKEVAGLVENVYRRSAGEGTRLSCLLCLARMNSAEGRLAAARLIEREPMSLTLRAAANACSHGDDPGAAPTRPGPGPLTATAGR